MRHSAELTEAGVKSKDYHLLSKAMDLLSICEMMCSLKRQLIPTLLLLPKYSVHFTEEHPLKRYLVCVPCLYRTI